MPDVPTQPEALGRIDRRREHRQAAVEGWLSFVVALFLLLVTGPRHPKDPTATAIAGMLGGVGFALALAALRFGTWPTRLVATFAFCGNLVVLLCSAEELYRRW